MRNPATALLTGTLILTLAGPVLAEPGKGASRMMKKLDTDGDGRIGLDEFRSGPRGNRMLEMADTDSDGMVTLAEMEAHHDEMMARRMEKMKERMQAHTEQMRDHFDEMDADDDGTLTREEMGRGIFSRLDSNGDGYIEEDEFRHPPMGGPGMHERHHRMGGNR